MFATPHRALKLRPFQKFFAPPPAPAEKLWATTADGVALALHRVRPEPGQGPAPAVLLVHGLGANRIAFHYPGRSLAEYLAARGFDCYVAELRGAGESGRPRAPWDLDDLLTFDVPALLARVRRACGQEQLHWVGHSLGGILLLCHAARAGAGELRSGLCVGSALHYAGSGSGFEPLLRLRRVLGRVPYIPFGALAHLLAPALARLKTPVELFNFWPTNVEPHIVRAVYALGFEEIPTRLLLQLAGMFAEPGLSSRDGALCYRAAAGSVRLPLRLLAGSKDAQCSVEAVEAAAAGLAAASADVLRFGRAFGHQDEYGHWDLLLGRRAPEEVWPQIAAWLERHARPQAS